MMQMVGSFAKFERAMNPGTDFSRPVRRPARKGGLVDGVKKLDAAKRHEIAEASSAAASLVPIWHGSTA
jgi:hypothetical protein